MIHKLKDLGEILAELAPVGVMVILSALMVISVASIVP